MKVGAILSYISIFITILVALLYTPVMIRLLGQSEYGLYALIGSVAAYFNILDLGLGNTIVRFISRNRINNDKFAEAKLNGMFLILYSIIGLITLVIGLLILNKINIIFGTNLSESEIKKAELMIIILTGNFALSFPLAVFSSILQAYERFIVVKVTTITRSVLVPVFTLPFLFIGYGSVTMVIITTVVNLSCLLFNLYYCFKYLDISFSFNSFDPKLLKVILTYSSLVFIGVIVDQINWNTDQFILGIFAGTDPVAIYAISMLFIRLYIQFSTAISGLLLPKVSIMVANNASDEDLSAMMIKFGRLQFIVLAYILSGFYLYGENFINIWAGANYLDAYYIGLIIMVPLTIPLIQNVGISILYAKNLQVFRSVVLIIIALLNVTISIPLSINYGGIGAAIATSLSLLCGNIIIMNIYYHRKIRINIPLFWKNIVSIFMSVSLAIVFGVAINWFVGNEGIIILLIKVPLYSTLYLLFLWNFAFNINEKKLLLSFLKSCMGIILKMINRTHK